MGNKILYHICILYHFNLKTHSFFFKIFVKIARKTTLYRLIQLMFFVAIFPKNFFKKTACFQVKILLLVLAATFFSCKPIKDNETYLFDGGQTYTAPIYYPQRYLPQVQPYSRAYTNPYATPPRQYYPYYDYDQYYVPPTGYTSGDDAITKY